MDGESDTLINNRYRLDEEVGRGGMGVVYHAWDTLLQRDVAIKILTQESLGSGGAERLLNEARVVARLDHPNIVTVFDAGQFKQRPFIVMQYIEGGTLADLRSEVLDEIYAIVIEICLALAHAHEHGVIHRDLKPENIFLDQTAEVEDGIGLIGSRVKIVDFGIAHSELASLTIQGEIVGTVSYMAPEQALGQETCPQTDLYALGVMLYELTTGDLPFAGDNTLSVISQHINSPVEPPSRNNPQISPQVDDLILRLMSKKPSERPSSAQEVAQLLGGQMRSESRSTVMIEAAKQPVHNLPVQLTSFIGRKDEIKEISQLLSQDSCRLLTLVGPGGIGKTRLAIEVAAQNLADYSDGICYVPMAPVPSPDFILTTIADALGLSLHTHGSVDPKNQLLDYLARRKSLLVLDNYEHLIDGTGMIIEILKHAADMKLLVTSRERLNLQGEWLFNVSGLTYPENGSSDGDIEGSALELFIERARSADSRFTINVEEREHIVHICRLVDGIPLGIELASSWVSVLSSQEIANEIEKNLDFLASTMQDIPEKHRSMRAAFDYSWEMLSEEQGDVFRKLSVFQGGFSRRAAEKVAGAGLLDLHALVDKSFVRRVEADRFEIHELLRQYGEKKLGEDAEAYRAINKNHSRYYLELLNQGEKKLIGEGQLEGRDEVQSEIENIRSAIHWRISEGNEKDVLSAFRILFNFYFIQGYYEGVESYKNFANIIADHYQPGFDPSLPGSRMYLSALAYQAYYLSMAGSIKASDELLGKLLPGLRDLDLQLELMVCLVGLGINCTYRGEYEVGEQYFIEANQIGERIQDYVGIVAVNIWLGWVYYEIGDHQAALKEWQKGESMSIELRNRLMLTFVQSKLALLGEDTGDFEYAIKMQLEARESFKYFGDQVGVGYATGRLSLSLLGIGEYQEAKRFGQESYRSFKEMNHRWGIPASLCWIGFAEIALGEYWDAWGHLIEALNLSQVGQISTLVLYSLVGVGLLLVKCGKSDQGVEILSYVIANPATPSLYREIAEEGLSDLEGELPEEAIAAAKERGETSELEQILDSIPENLSEELIA
jgi:serine/threonine protein kinase/tetratricopeptide (TPR) repeat protein